jgi:hypothetical protein
VSSANDILKEIEGKVEELNRIFGLIDKAAAFVNKVDIAVGILEVQVAESTREYNVRAVKATLSPLGKWFGVSAAPNPMPAVVRPPGLEIDKEMEQIRRKEEKEEKEEENDPKN